MANLLNFKFGAFANLPVAKTAGTVYVTTDEQAMYIDLPNKDDASTIDRLRIGDIIVKDSVKTAAPPFAEGAFYYFVKENALVRWDGTTWKQINTTDGVVEALNAFKTEADNRLKALESTTATHTSEIATLKTNSANHVTKTEFETFKSENDDAIADAKKAGTDAAAAAQTAQTAANGAQTTANSAKTTAENALPKAGGTMTGAIAMSNQKITGLGAPTNDRDAATKEYVDDAEGRAKADAATALAAANAADTAADNAQAKADSAYTLADTANKKANSAYTLAESKVTLAEVEALDYATNTEAQGYADAVLGTSTDDSSKATVYGAIKKAAEAKSAADAAQQTANSKVTMAQVEALDYATKTEAQGYADAVLGNANNTANDKTVYGALAAAAAAQEQADKGVADAATAKAAADGAQSTANQAKTAAATADGKADTAQARADAAYSLAEDANENAETRLLKTTHETFVASNTAELERIEGKVDVNTVTANKGVSDAAAAKKAADDAQAAADAASAKAGTMLPLAGGTMTGAINMGSQKITNLATPTDNADAATKKYVDDAKSAAVSAANAANTAATNAMNKALEMLPKDGSGEMTGNLKMGSKKIVDLADPTANTDAANKQYVDAAIAAGIKANDAMTFKGTLGGTGATVSSLPTSGVQKGDTYKVSASGTYADIAAKVGDLFINIGEDDATPSWTHVSSGYEDDYLQRFVAVNGKVYLTDGVNTNATNAKGSLAFAGATGTNLSFSVSGSGNNMTVTGTMEWGTF